MWVSSLTDEPAFVLFLFLFIRLFVCGVQEWHFCVLWWSLWCPYRVFVECAPKKLLQRLKNVL